MLNTVNDLLLKKVVDCMKMELIQLYFISLKINDEMDVRCTYVYMFLGIILYFTR